MLQPSIYARGARNFVFPGQVDDWHAPGIWTSRGETRSAVDAAWLVEKVLGAARHRPHIWPGVPGAAERARAYGAYVGLRHYQQEGAAFLAERDYVILADQMGIGKTAEALAAAEARLSLGSIPDTQTPVVLVVAPALAKHVWKREIKKWTGYEAITLEGMRPDDSFRARYVIANYDILYSAQRREATGVLYDVARFPGWASTLAGRFLITIFDEAHLLRGRSSRRSAAAKMLCRGVPVVWALTGTPMPNYVRDLWGLIDIVTDGLHGKYWPWAKKYCEAKQGTHGWDDKGRSNVDELGQRLSFFMIGRTKDTVGLELPPMVREVYKIDVELTAPTRAEGVKALDKTSAVMSAFRRTAYAKRSAVVAQAVEGLQAGQKVVVALYMREQCDAVAKDIKSKVDCSVMLVHGDLSPEARDAQATTFRDAAPPCCFVCTIDSVGIAISLVGADLLIFGDLVPEPWKLLQMEKRTHRLDSKNSVLIRYMIATGTIDEGLAESVIEKLETLEQTLGTVGENAELSKMLGGKTTEEIVDSLFAKLLKGTQDA